MLGVRRWRHVVFPLVVILILGLGVFGCGNGEEEVVNGEEEEVEEAEVNGEEEEDKGKEEAMEDEEGTAETDEVNPYDEAEKIVPMDDRNIVMDEDFRSVFDEVFENEPKLVSTGDITALSYVVDRVITTDDVSKIKDHLEEKGYETVGTRTEAKEYEFDISIAEDILEEKYDGDPGGNMYVVIWTAEEGENAQRIVVRLL